MSRPSYTISGFARQARVKLSFNHLSKKYPPPPEPDDRVNPDLFNIHVTPDLLAIIGAYGRFLKLEMCDYRHAYRHCVAFAWRKGAWGFNPENLSVLQNWIHDRLADAISGEE